MAERKNVLITGATKGIGRDAALSLARLGFRVIATGRSAGALAKLRAEAPDLAIDVVELDVDRPDSIAAAAARVEELTLGHGIDVLVNNAGFASVSPLADLTDASLRAQFETNVFGLMAVTRRFLPKMMARGWGRIINVSSSGGRISLPFVGAYHGAKFAVEALSDALRWELSPFGVRVVVIEPGPIRTEFVDRMLASTTEMPRDSRYAPIYDSIAKFQSLAERQMSEPAIVTRAIIKAATARRPRARYLMPWRVGFAIALFHLLPTRWGDWLMCRLTSLTRSKLGLGDLP